MIAAIIVGVLLFVILFQCLHIAALKSENRYFKDRKEFWFKAYMDYKNTVFNDWVRNVKNKINE